MLKIRKTSALAKGTNCSCFEFVLLYRLKPLFYAERNRKYFLLGHKTYVYTALDVATLGHVLHL